MSAALKMSALERAKEEAWSTPLDKLDVSKAERFASNTHWPFFERLRKEAPVHYCAESMHGAYWSITKFHDIVAVDSDLDRFASNTHWPFFERLRKEAPVHYCAESMHGAYWSITKFHDIVAVDSNHRQFSSQHNIVIGDNPPDFAPPMFIAEDPPKHDVQRHAVTPAVAPARLADLEALIRERVGVILDGLPRGETFNWVDRVSIELTTQMLATLFDFPWEDRRKLSYWSDVSTAVPY